MAEREQSPFGRLVRQHRERLGLTQQALADRLTEAPTAEGRFSVRTIQEWERAYPPGTKWRSPHPANLQALATVLQIPLDTAAGTALQQAARQHQSGPPLPQVDPSPSTNGERAFISAGREDQIVQLQGLIDDVAAGHSGIAFVEAELGSGKSWLVAETVRQGLARYPALAVLWGESPLHGDPYQPIRQMLAMMTGSPSGAQRHIPADLVTAPLARRLPQGLDSILVNQAGLIDRFLPVHLLAAQTTNPMLDEPLRARLSDAVTGGYAGPGSYGPTELAARTLLDYASGPTILVFEDLHWADTGTAAVLHHLVEHIAQSPIPLGIIGTYRPSELNPASGTPPSAVARAVRTAQLTFPNSRIDLASTIGSTAGRRFVEAVVATQVTGAPANLAEHLFATTVGTPLFVDEMLTWYRNQGALVAGQSVIGLSWHHAPQAIPPSIVNLIQYRLDLVPPDLRQILDLAAVQGTVFSAEIVQAVLGLTTAELGRFLNDELTMRLDLVREADTSTTAGVRSHDYAFRHALFQGTLYDRLSPFERDHLHLSTAEAMANRWGDAPHDGCARIAFHFQQAGDKVQAGTWALRGGNYWLDRHHYEEARALFNTVQSLDLRQIEPFLAAQSLIGLGNCDRSDGDLDAGRANFAEAQRIARREHLALVEANAITSEAMLDFDSGRMAHGTKLLTSAVDVLMEFGDFHEACRSMILLSHTLHGAGHYDEAVRRAKEAIELAHGLDYELLEAGAMIALGNCWLDIGLYDRAIGVYEECLEICERHENTHRCVLCWLNIALGSLELGLWERGLANLERVYALGSTISPRLVGAADFNRAVIAELTGDWTRAETSYRDSLEIRDRYDQQALRIDSLAGLGRVAAAKGDEPAVQRLLMEIEGYLAANGPDGVEHPGRLFVTLVDGWGMLGESTHQLNALRRGLALVDERAAGLIDPVHRHALVDVVPSHRALRERAARLEPKPAIGPSP